MLISWLYLLLAVIAEVTGTTCMKMAEGFTQLIPSLSMIAFYLVSLCAATMAMKAIDVSVAYAIWSGLGTVLIALIGIAWFREPVSLSKVISISMIVSGVMGLKLSTSV